MQQISVFLENHSGQIAEITEALSENDINLHALNMAETKEYGVLRLITEDPAKAAEVLMTKGFLVTKREVVGVLVQDHTGGLNAVLSVIAQSGIDIDYMYAALVTIQGQALMIFRVEDAEAFCQVLEQNGIAIARDLQQ